MKKANKTICMLIAFCLCLMLGASAYFIPTAKGNFVSASKGLYLSSTNSNFSYVLLTYKFGNEVIANDLLEYNSSMINLRIIDAEDYTFGGWYYDQALTMPVLSSDRLTDNTTVYLRLIQLSTQPKTAWQRIGDWCSAVENILTLVSLCLAIALSATTLAFYKKRFQGG